MDMDMDMDIEVEFDLNPTDLYNHICDSDWESALYCIDADPIEAKIWVVKRQMGDFPDGEIACRFLPLHSACARQPPLSVISSLLDSYPEGAAIRDDNGMYPLHYACANQASPEVIQLLLSTFPEANFFRVETNGNLPVHLVAQWGASSVSVIDILLENSISLACAKDFHDNSPLEIALAAGAYENRKGIIHRLEDAVELADMDDMTSSTITTTTWSIHQDQLKDSEEAETVVQGNNVPHSTTKSMTRMKAEIMALRAQSEFIRAEADEQIAHEWKEIRYIISELSEENESRTEHISTDRKAQGVDRSVRDNVDDIDCHPSASEEVDIAYPPSIDEEEDISCSLTAEEQAKLKTIVEENKMLKLEYNRVKKICDAYQRKLGTTRDIISELSQHTKKLVREQNVAHDRVNVIESNMQVISAWRQTRLHRILREEKNLLF